MASLIFLGVGAGFVSALLFSSVSIGGLFAVLLMYLAPLPILIVGLGWHGLVALLALSCGGLVTSALIRPEAGVAFALGPALAGTALAVLPIVPSQALPPALRPAADGLGAGLLLLACGLLAALMAFAALLTASGLDYTAYGEALRGAAGAVIRSGTATLRPGSAAGDFVRVLVTLAPALLAGLLAVVLAANLWLAGKAVAISGRLPVPWPDIPASRIPAVAVPVLGAALLVSLAPGFVGVAGAALAGGLLVAFALGGLAVLHDVSRGRAGRGALLSAAYLLTLVLGSILLPLFALLGIADSATPRLRDLGRKPPPTP